MSARYRRDWSTTELTADLVGRLLADRWLAVTEVQLERGQRADVLAMRRKFDPSPMLIFEIKTSRADLFTDLRREKWRGYLRSGAVAFAFHKALADPSEIPAEAGVYVRNQQGWSWARAPRWAQAPLPSDWLHRRMSMTVSDQQAARIDALYRPRVAISAWTKATTERQKRAQELARVAFDIEFARSTAANLEDRKNQLTAEIISLEMQLEDMREQPA